jgi:hypothetical protein
LRIVPKYGNKGDILCNLYMDSVVELWETRARESIPKENKYIDIIPWIKRKPSLYGIVKKKDPVKL